MLGFFALYWPFLLLAAAFVAAAVVGRWDARAELRELDELDVARAGRPSPAPAFAGGGGGARGDARGGRGELDGLEGPRGGGPSPAPIDVTLPARRPECSDA